MDIGIRPATAQDFEAVYHFINELEDQVFDRLKQEIIYLKNIQNPANIYLIALDGDSAVGFISCHIQDLLHHSGAIGEIQEMFVVWNYRSKGVGKALMRKLCAEAVRRRVPQLEVTSNKVRQKAHGFYLREGFKETHFKFTLPLE